MSIIKKKIKLKSFVFKYCWVAIIPFLAYFFILSLNKHKEIDKSMNYAYGEIYASQPIHNRHFRKRYKYHFVYNGQKYSGSSSTQKSKNVRIGNIYKVEFSDKNPNDNRIIFEKEYLKVFKYDNNKIIDTTYVLKDLETKKKINGLVEKFKYTSDSIN